MYLTCLVPDGERGGDSVKVSDADHIETCLARAYAAFRVALAFLEGNGMTALARTPGLPEATLARALSAQSGRHGYLVDVIIDQ